MHKYYLFLIPIFFLTGCTQSTDSNSKENRIALSEGDWRFTMNLNGKLLPFNARLENIGSSPYLELHNGEEIIKVEKTILRNDSLIASLPVFDTELLLRVESSDMVSGYYVDHNRDNYRISLTGEYGRDFRFTSSKSSRDIYQRYEVVFTESDQSNFPATLVLSNDSGRVEGTFMTEKGDYRYLEGNLMNGRLYLSTFDGSHAFYFQANIEGDSLTNGTFLSGVHYESNWRGKANPNASLSDPESLTRLKGNIPFDFKLPNQHGDTVTYASMGLEGKIVIIDLMGTWCPNCMDAARSLASISKEYDDLVIVPVLFESENNLNHARKSYKKFSSELNLSEDFLFGGRASKKVAHEKFPMLTEVSSFPTLIFLNRSGDVVRIYTGFYGPATGENHRNFLSTTRSLLDSLSQAS